MKKTAEIIGSKIAILMSTYNGELFLNKQINSLLNQTHKLDTLRPRRWVNRQYFKYFEKIQKSLPVQDKHH